jgi:hypothetical protein
MYLLGFDSEQDYLCAGIWHGMFVGYVLPELQWSTRAYGPHSYIMISDLG